MGRGWRNRTCRRRYAVLPVVLPALLVTMWLHLDRRPEMSRYISPRLDTRGTRIELLVPYGWRLDQDASVYLLPGTETTLQLGAPDSFGWLPRPLRDWLPWQYESAGEMVVNWHANPVAERSVRYDSFSYPAPRSHVMVRERSSPGKGQWRLWYRRNDGREAFFATYPQVRDSVVVH
jgi:hypothetical protein